MAWYWILLICFVVFCVYAFGGVTMVTEKQKELFHGAVIGSLAVIIVLLIFILYEVR